MNGIGFLTLNDLAMMDWAAAASSSTAMPTGDGAPEADEVGDGSGDPVPIGTVTPEFVDYVRNNETLFLYLPNPFYGAEAIYGDFGAGITGGEWDGGVLIILAGKDAGNVYRYYEIAGGVDFGVSGSMEFGVIQYSGIENEFKAGYCFGERQKVYGAIGPGLFSFGSGYAWGPVGGSQFVYSYSIQASFGPSIFINCGYNSGGIWPW